MRNVSRLKRLVCFLGAVVVFPATGLSGPSAGGILQFREEIPEGEFIVWPGSSYLPMDEEKGEMRLDRPEPEHVIIVKSEYVPSVTLIVAESKPFRLFRDLNGDGKPQPGEIHFPKKGVDTDRPCFEGVPMPMLIGDATRTVRQGFAYDPESESLGILRVTSCYTGSLSVGGKEYPARLTFRSLVNKNATANEFILLDTSGDGMFDYAEDTGFSGVGTAWIDKSLWNVMTTYEGDSAIVSLTPYTGRSGKLKVIGDSVCGLLLTAANGKVPDSPGMKSFVIAVPGVPGNEYGLPIGAYTLSETFLLFDESSDTLYQSPGSSTRGSDFTIFPGDQEVRLENGGPLSSRVTTPPTNITGTIRAEYEIPKTPRGLEFLPTLRGKDRNTAEAPFPTLEIVDGKGNIIRSTTMKRKKGWDEFAEGSVRMPLFGFGTYTARVSGIDTAFFRNKPAVFYYSPLRPLVLVLLIPLVFIGVGRLRKDAVKYSKARYLVLAPGIAGVVVAVAGKRFAGDGNEMQLLFYAFSIPLQILSAGFLVWGFYGIRNTLRAATALVTVSIPVLWVNCAEYNPMNVELPLLFLSDILCTVIIASPLIVFLYAARRDIKSLWWLFFGALAGPATLLIATGCAWWDYVELLQPLMTVAALSLLVLSFCILVRRNAWAKAVVTGRTSSPTVPKSDIDKGQT